MVMSSPDGPKDEEEKLDLSYQNHTGRSFRRGRHPNSTFKRTILDKADLTEANFSHSDFRKASLVEADLMKSSFDNCDFRGANLKKARLNLSTFRNCQFDDADIRGIRGKYAIWAGSNWWDASLDDGLRKALEKKWPKKDYSSSK